MFAIYKKELKSYLHSVIGFLFMAVLLFFMGFYFTVINLSYGSPYISYTLNGVVIVFLFSIPILTMRVIAEEQKAKTDQMLYTSPVGIGRIILGKYFALSTMLLITLAIFSIYPLILSIFGSIPYGESYMAILGFLLFGLACIAIGVFVSSLTESQVIAAVITFGILLVSFLISGISSIISATGNLLTKFLSIFSMSSRLDNLLNGVCDLNALLYYLSVIVIFLFLTYQVIQKKRWTISNQGMKKGVYNAALTIIIPLIIIGINIGASFIPTDYTNLDVTSERLFTLTDTTKSFLDALTDDVTIYSLSSEDTADNNIDMVLNRYESYSDHITVEYKDPSAFPNFAAQYDGEDLDDNSLIVVCGDRFKTIPYNDCFESSVDYTTYSTTNTGLDVEGQVTSAISYVLGNDMPKVYNISGHNELEFTDTLNSSISKENIDTQTINLMNYDSIPEDAQCIIIAGPTTDFSEDDANKVKAYLEAGGNALIFTGYTQVATPNFDSILNSYGVQIADGVVFEGTNNYYYQLPFYLLPELNDNSITADLYASKRLILCAQAEGLVVNDSDDSDDTYVEELLTTSDAAYSKLNVENMESYDKADGDVDGPFTLGVSIEKDIDADTTMNMIVYSTEYLLDENLNQMVSGANYELVMNSLTNMVDETSSIYVPVKSFNMDNIAMSGAVVLAGGIISVIVIPFGFLIAGFVIWFKRRKR